MVNQEFRLKPSLIYIVSLITFFILTLGIWFLLPLPLVVAMPGALVILAYGLNILRRHALLSNNQSINWLQLQERRQWKLRTRGDVFEADLCADSTVTGWISILRFKVAHKRFPIACIILKDSLPAGSYRQLLICLRMN